MKYLQKYNKCTCILLYFFKECKITSTSAGNNHLVFGDTLGQIHLVSRSWHITSFRGFEISVDHTYQLRNSPLLVTIGVSY